MDPRKGMSAREAHDWEWRALPGWAKAITLLVGLPCWLVWLWAVIDDNVPSTVQTVCFGLFVAVALMQIACLTWIIRLRRPK